MSCCMCAGLCGHSGSHIYCAIHSQGYLPSVTIPLPLGPSYLCEHCYCRGPELVDSYGVPHLICCKCSNRVAAKFVKGYRE